MGQYHKPVCIDTMETIHPHKLGDGLKLMEFGMSGSGTMAGLALLLAGEGRWAGKRIVIVGDYAESGDIEGIDVVPLYKDREEYDRYVDRYPEAIESAGEAGFLVHPDGSIKRKARW